MTCGQASYSSVEKCRVSEWTLQRTIMPSPVDSTITPADTSGAAEVRLLIIEDESLHAMLIGRAAGMAGFVAVNARSLADAAILLREIRFDCITLDLSLGVGQNVAEIFRMLGEVHCKAPIVIISGATALQLQLTASMAKSQKLNVVETVPKPVDFAMLRKTLAGIKAKLDQQPARQAG
jgi:DNA-binding response OmpR family regulator